MQKQGGRTENKRHNGKHNAEECIMQVIRVRRNFKVHNVTALRQ